MYGLDHKVVYWTDGTVNKYSTKSLKVVIMEHFVRVVMEKQDNR